jgi:hypothetical protein
MTKKRILGCLRVLPVEYHWFRGILPSVSNCVCLRNLKGGGQGPIRAIERLDGWMVTICSTFFI